MSTVLDGIQPKLAAILEAALDRETLEYLYTHPPKHLSINVQSRQEVYRSATEPDICLWDQGGQEVAVQVTYIGKDPEEIVWLQQKYGERGWDFRSGNMLERYKGEILPQAHPYATYGFVVALQ